MVALAGILGIQEWGVSLLSHAAISLEIFGFGQLLHIDNDAVWLSYCLHY